MILLILELLVLSRTVALVTAADVGTAHRLFKLGENLGNMI